MNQQLTAIDARLERLLAQREIENVIATYCQAVDRRDWEKLLTCYHADAVDVHGAFTGPPAEFVEWLKDRHANVTASMHFIGNIAVEFATDAPELARVETYCISHRTTDAPQDDPYFSGLGVEGELRRTIACRYVDTFQYRPVSGWRILRRTVVMEWMRREPAELYLSIAPDVAISRRDRTDPLYAPLATPPAGEGEKGVA